MTHRVPIAILGLALALAAAGAAAAQGIQGSYILHVRVLPDGTEQHPPEVYGMLTYTRELRNFNIAWDNPDGTRTTISYLAGYVIAGDRYCESPEIWVQHAFGDVPGFSNEPPAAKRDECGTVSIDGDTWTVTVPGEPPTLTFTPDGMTAVAEGMFTDHWRRIE